MSDVENVIEQNKKHNPLMEKLRRIPGETFRIPSKGIFYKNGELESEVVDGEVTIYPMAALDELMMKSPDMLFQGTAIDQVIKRCVPQVIKPMEMLASDLDYLLTCLRKVTYGEYMPIKHTCKECGENAQAREYNIPLSHFLKNSKELTQADYDSMTFTLNNFKIKLKPATFIELVELYRTTDDGVFTNPDKTLEFIIKSFLPVIEQVDKVKDKEMIKEWLSKLPAPQMQQLNNKISLVNKWGIKFEYTFKCMDCNKDIDISASLNPVNFFMLPSGQETTNE